MHRAVTDGILLSILTVLLVTVLGLVTMNPLFKILGANNEVLPFIKEYMIFWYIGKKELLITCKQIKTRENNLS